jgi:hypothetical protein
MCRLPLLIICCISVTCSDVSLSLMPVSVVPYVPCIQYVVRVPGAAAVIFCGLYAFIISGVECSVCLSYIFVLPI